MEVLSSTDDQAGGVSIHSPAFARHPYNQSVHHKRVQRERVFIAKLFSSFVFFLKQQ